MRVPPLDFRPCHLISSGLPSIDMGISDPSGIHMLRLTYRVAQKSLYPLANVEFKSVPVYENFLYHPSQPNFCRLALVSPEELSRPPHVKVRVIVAQPSRRLHRKDGDFQKSRGEFLNSDICKGV
jgi:hypothetical protein